LSGHQTYHVLVSGDVSLLFQVRGMVYGRYVGQQDRRNTMIQGVKDYSGQRGSVLLLSNRCEEKRSFLMIFPAPRERQVTDPHIQTVKILPGIFRVRFSQ
jgi:hypothetical protein